MCSRQLFQRCSSDGEGGVGSARFPLEHFPRSTIERTQCAVPCVSRVGPIASRALVKASWGLEGCGCLGHPAAG